MKLKKKNQKLFIIVGVLLLFGGISLAYFVSKAILGGNGGSTSVTTAVINGATLNVEGVLSFEDLDILPGHKTVSSIKVTATGNNELIPYNLIWQGTNTLTTPLNFTIYKTSEQLSVTSTCSKKTKIISGAQALSEECTISNLDKLGNEIASGTINKNETKVTLVKDEFITAINSGIIYYYYIILEYPNLDEPQNEDLNGTFEGKVTIEESNVKPDINILAAYIEEDGKYKEVEDIPQEGYVINQEKSTCSNGTIPNWDTKTHTFSTSNLTKSGTSCYLYFDKYSPIASEFLISTNELISENGYRYEGEEVNNYITFNDELWRIIGVFETTKSDGNKDNLLKIIRNESINNVSWDNNHKNNWTTSTLKDLLNNGDYYNRIGVYNNNGLTEDSKNIIENVVWNLGGVPTSEITTEAIYKAEQGTKVYSGNSTEWIGKVGLMYASDYGYASPSSTCIRTTTLYNYKNTGCKDNNWLYKSNAPWTMTHNYNVNNYVLFITYGVDSNGSIHDCGNVPFSGYNASPSVYLKSSVKIISGDGTESNPYIISN